MATSLRRAAQLRAAKRTAAKATNRSNAGFKFPAGGNANYRKAAVAEFKKSGNLNKANAAGIKARGANKTRAGRGSQSNSA